MLCLFLLFRRFTPAPRAAPVYTLAWGRLLGLGFLETRASLDFPWFRQGLEGCGSHIGSPRGATALPWRPGSDQSGDAALEPTPSWSLRDLDTGSEASEKGRSDSEATEQISLATHPGPRLKSEETTRGDGRAVLDHHGPRWLRVRHG